MTIHKTDLVIIGAGPIGLFAVFEAGMLKIKSHIIDSLEIIGGQCSALYPEKPIYDIPAHPSILASELIEKLQTQISPFDPVYHLNQRVEKVVKNAVSTFNIRNKAEFIDKKVVIAGGGDSAVDWAIALSEIAKKVFVVHRRDKFRCAPESAEKLKILANNKKIEIVIPFQLEGLEGKNGLLKSVIVKDFDNNIKSLEADYLLPFFGLATELGPIADWGLNLERNHIEVDVSNMKTSITGIYAIGDIANYKNKLKLILTGFSEAALAAHDIYKIIYPDQIFHFEYSTSKGVG